MAYTTVDNPSATAFNTVLYTGNGSTNAITGVGFQPDFVWIKERNGASGHLFKDSVRGATPTLVSNSNGVEGDFSAYFTSFDSDGFTLPNNTASNESSSYNYVSWNWKMGTSFSNDASATSIGTIDSSGSINTTAGQSIISWTGTGSAATIAHGLGAVPTMIIVKNRDQNDDWYIYNVHNGNTHSIILNSTGAKVGAYSDNWNNTTPTSTVFSVGGSHATSGGSSEKMIAYCFTDIKGYSKFGSYTGNGEESGKGPYINLGFRPAFFLLKETSGTDPWTLMDTKRLGYNPRNDHLFPNATTTEYATDRIEMLSNGIKIRDSDGSINQSGSTYIYMAFAEAPLVNSNGVPVNAR